MDSKQKTGLILTGGGARAACQAGVLHAISRILQDAGRSAAYSPFDIICGTSAGALNATALACRSDNFASGVRGLLAVWENVVTHTVYRADSLALLRSGAALASYLLFEASYTRELIRLGEHDSLARRDDVLAFFAS